MRHPGTKQWSYTLLLAASFIIVGLLMTGPLQLNTHDETPLGSFEHAEVAENPSAEPETPPETPETPPEEVLPEEPQETPKPVKRTADSTYFNDALFIGDSRTMGLWEYGDLGTATVLADSGMSVYKVWDAAVKKPDGQTAGLLPLLEENTYGKVYIMLGINELGYSFEPTVKKYQELVDTIRQYQSEAVIFVQANMHISTEKSAASDIFNNENINRFNEAVKQMADEEQVFYLDVNPLFDDENGALSEEYTSDQVHVLGKYYIDWTNWLLEQAVFYE